MIALYSFIADIDDELFTKVTLQVPNGVFCKNYRAVPERIIE